MSEWYKEKFSELAKVMVGNMNRAYTNAFSDAVNYGVGYIKFKFDGNVLTISNPKFDELKE